MQVDSTRGADRDAKEARENVAFVEADAAAAAIAVARTEALESVEYTNEAAGGTGMMVDKTRAREWKVMIQKAVLEHGVGKWEAKVR